MMTAEGERIITVARNITERHCRRRQCNQRYIDSELGGVRRTKWFYIKLVSPTLDTACKEHAVTVRLHGKGGR